MCSSDLEEVTYVDIESYGKQAEIIAKYCGKGSGILVEGRLKLDQWEDKKTGEKRSKLGILGEGMQFLNRAATPAEGGGTNVNRARQLQFAPTAAAQSNNGPIGPDDDVPF